MIERYTTHRTKLELQTGRPKSQIKPEVHIDIPLDYANSVIRNYLYTDQNQSLSTPSQRSTALNYIFNVSFADLKRITGDTAMSEYDDYKIEDYLVDYKSRFTSKQYSSSFKALLTMIANYLLVKSENMKQKQQDFEANVTSYDKQISASNPYDPEWSWDDFIKPKSELDIAYANACQIRQKPSKRYPLQASWQTINTTVTPYTEMDDEQRQTFDEMNRIRNIAKKLVNSSSQQKLLYTIAKELEHKLKILESMQIERSIQKKRVDTDYLELINNQILDEFDYTNQTHIHGLIRNYFDLWNTYHYQTDSPLYSILTEFKHQVGNVNFQSPLHKEILDTFLHNSSNDKKNAEYIGMSTEPMNRSLKQSISKTIAKHFQKNSY
ncbi:hypothetical protein NYE24_00520 [Paenibacillus sp. FSL H7-0350]|uniref:hypothetical protein n=1 Tax=Paenibacillus sp. FSL H7-0350 TaxID=2975345 RepID=UPI003158DB4B